MSIEEFRRDIKLIISEIDGIITNGLRTEDEMGHVLFKSFNVKDLAAINELKKSYKFVFLSDDNSINYNFCRRKNIPFYWAQNEEEKYEYLVKIMQRYSCIPDQVVFVASKVSDKKCAQLIPKSICPDDSGLVLKSACFTTFKNKSGEGILTELLDLLKGMPEYVD